MAANEPSLPSSASLVDPLKKIQALEQREIELEAKIQLAEKAVEQAQLHPNPALQAGRQEIARLNKQKEVALLGLYKAKAEALGLGLPFAFLGSPFITYWMVFVDGILMVASLLALYLWKYKRDLVFRVAFREMRASLGTTIRPSGTQALGIKDGHYLGAILLVFGIVAAAFLVLLLWSMPAMSATSAQEAGVPFWEIRQDNFGKNVDDFKYLIASEGYGKLSFVMEHPLSPRFDPRLYRQGADQQVFSFKRTPPIDFPITQLRVNSFEYLFLLGRLLYEDGGKDDTAFSYLSMLTNVRELRFDNPQLAEVYVLNLLKIAIMKGRGQQFEALKAAFIDFARPELRFDLASFLVFEADKGEGFKLYRHLLPTYPEMAMELATTIVGRLGPQETYVFYAAAQEELAHANSPVQAGRIAQALLQSMLKVWSSLRVKTSPGQATPEQVAASRVYKDYVALLRRVLESPALQNDTARLQALSVLADEMDQRDFVRAQLGQLASKLNSYAPVDAYLLCVQLKAKLGDKSDSDNLLDRAYSQDYAHSPSDLEEIVTYCINVKDVERAVKALNSLFGNFQQYQQKRASEQLVKLLGLDLPVPQQGISMLCVYALLNQRIMNQGVCLSKMEEANKVGLENSLTSYARKWDLNINELFYLLEVYREQGNFGKFNTILPIFQAAAERYRREHEPRANEIIAGLEKRLAQTEDSLKQLAPSPEELAAMVTKLKREISDIESQAKWVITKAKLQRTLVLLTFILLAAYTLCTVFFCLCRGAYYARRVAQFKMGVFWLRFLEGVGFSTMLTIVPLPIGVSLVTSSQFLLRLIQVPLDEAVIEIPTPVEREKIDNLVGK